MKQVYFLLLTHLSVASFGGAIQGTLKEVSFKFCAAKGNQCMEVIAASASSSSLKDLMVLQQPRVNYYQQGRKVKTQQGDFGFIDFTENVLSVESEKGISNPLISLKTLSPVSSVSSGGSL